MDAKVYAVRDMSPYALLGIVDMMLAELVRKPELAQGDKATCVLLGLQARELRRKYEPRAAVVAMRHQFAMLPGAPEAERDALLRRAAG